MSVPHRIRARRSESDDAELFEPCQPLVEGGAGVDFEPHVIEPGAPGIEGFALIPVVLLELDDGPPTNLSISVSSSSAFGRGRQR